MLRASRGMAPPLFIFGVTPTVPGHPLAVHSVGLWVMPRVAVLKASALLAVLTPVLLPFTVGGPSRQGCVELGPLQGDPLPCSVWACWCGGGRWG